jgi:hypothetical protein
MYMIYLFSPLENLPDTHIYLSEEYIVGKKERKSFEDIK